MPTRFTFHALTHCYFFHNPIVFNCGHTCIMAFSALTLPIAVINSLNVLFVVVIILICKRYMSHVGHIAVTLGHGLTVTCLYVTIWLGINKIFCNQRLSRCSCYKCIGDTQNGRYWRKCLRRSIALNRCLLREHGYLWDKKAWVTVIDKSCVNRDHFRSRRDGSLSLPEKER